MMQSKTKLWPTPRAVDGIVRHSKSWMQKRIDEDRDVDLTTMVKHIEQPAPRQQLNPDWVELLQGFPTGWTNISV